MCYKLSLFAEDVISYIKKSDRIYKKLLELISLKRLPVQDQYKKIKCIQAPKNPKLKLKIQYHLQ